MNLQPEKAQQYYDPVTLMDSLLSYKIDSTTFIENETLVKTLCDAIDNLIKKEQGYTLLSVSVSTSSSIKLITKQNHRLYNIHSWTYASKIDKPISITINEEGNDDLEEWMEKATVDNKIQRRMCNELWSYLITESLTGVAVNKKNVLDHCKFLKQHEKEYKGSRGTPKFDIAFKIYDDFIKQLDTVSKDIRTTILDYSSRLDCDKLKVNIKQDAIHIEPFFVVAEIVKVKEVNNVRTYQVDCSKINKSDINGITMISNRLAGVKSDTVNYKAIGNLAIVEVKDYYNSGPLHIVSQIPYEFIDEGRLIVFVCRGNFWNAIIGPDPRSSTEEPVANITRILEQYIDTVLKRTAEVSASIKDKDNTYLAENYASTILKENPDIKPLQLHMKSIKRMLDEFNYIVKKEKAKGQDVTITDKVKYNHERGEVSYNDFSFAVNDELIKNEFMNVFNHYVVEYYRGNLTEEQILNDILSKIFTSISNRLGAYSQENTIMNIKLNNAVDVKLEIRTSKSLSKLIYINDQRFNKNEAVTVLKEMTCYRSQAEADMFIKNIGKIGLSVYIAISTGYEVEFKNKNNQEESVKRIFKFRKHKGRSNYSLILDTIEIPIVGKVLINTLYSRFIGESVSDFEQKVPKLIMNSVSSSLEYAKYKFLIDSTYTAFQKNSMDFLTKKVNDVGGSFCKYYNASNHKLLDAITVKGTTGNTYIITYDKTNSWVFINPTFKEDKYEGGKYVCMIDQSNIKSNIGYDTVIAKLMALKNDSVIASKIYNLKEEIDG